MADRQVAGSLEGVGLGFFVVLGILRSFGVLGISGFLGFFNGF